MHESLIGIELSQNQKRTWQFLNKSINQYTHLVFEIDNVKSHELIAAIRAVINEHEILRSAFKTVIGIPHPLQTLSSKWTGSLEEFDFSKNAGIIDTEKIELVMKESIDLINTVDSQIYWNIRLIQTTERSSVLSLVFSSMIADVRSVINLVHEIEDKYNNDPGVIKDNYQFSQFSEWHNALLKEEVDEDSAATFKFNFEKLDLKLPFESNGKFHKGSDDRVLNFEFDQKQIEKIESLLVMIPGLSMSDIYRSIWYLLIWNYTGNASDMVMGSAMEYRPYEEFKTIFGPFLTILPLNLVPESTDTFAEFSMKLSLKNNKIQESQEYFSLSELNSQKGKLLPCSFPFVFEYINLKSLSESSFNNIRLINRYDNSKLKLTCQDYGNKIVFELIENGSLVVEQSIDEIHAKFLFTLDRLLDDPQVVLTQLFSPCASEKMRLLNLSKNKMQLVNDRTLVELFEEQARKYPNKVALHFLDKQLSYSELDTMSNSIANWLLEKKKIQKGDCVAVQLKRSELLIATILGIIKANGVYLPMPLDLPKKRLNYILEDSQAILLISDFVDIDSVEVECFTSGNLENEIRGIGSNKPLVEIQSEDLVYIIYTSGSSGKPKGVAIRHKSLGNYLNWFKTNYSITDSDNSLLLSSIAFDLSYTSLWSPLVTGGTLFIVEETPYFNTEEVIRYLATYNITYIKATPSHFNMIVNDFSFDKKVADFSLKWILLGGEKILIEDLRQYYQKDSTTRFVNHYGPTETTIGVLTQTISHDSLDVFSAKPVIGHPIANTQVYILDEQQNTVSIGFIGEIAISGDGLAKGYINNDELTQISFTRNPLVDSGKIYRTGDLGRMLPDGAIEFLGRKDSQSKVRGYRIELGEIESALNSQDRVEQAVVLLDSSTDESQIIAFYKSADPLDHNKMHNELKEWLPDYMLPHLIIHIKDIPLNQNGKIDRIELMRYSVEKTQKKLVLPQGKYENAILEIWKEVLGKDEISTTDNYLEIGGHSLKAVQILSRILKQLDIKIELRDIFTHATIQELAKHLEVLKKTKFKSIPVVPKQTYYDLSINQKRLWVLDQFKESKVAYNRPSGYYFENLDINAFTKAFAELIQRHESLRTNFVMINGEPKQKINENVFPDFQVTDLRGEEYLDRIEEVKNEEINKPFDLSSDVLLRGKLLRYDENKYLFLFTIHHITTDGWSVEILTNELMRLYDAFSNNLQNPLVPLDIQYKDYTYWYNEWVDSEDSKEYRNFWNGYLSGNLPRLSIPLDNPRASVKSYNGSFLEFFIDDLETIKLKNLTMSKGGSLFMIILAILDVMFYKISEQEDIIIGTVDSGRNHQDLENQVGFYINILALRNSIKGDQNFDQILLNTINSTLEVYKYKMYPFDKIIENLALPRSLNRFPLFDVVLSVQNANVEQYALDRVGEDMETTYFDTGFVKSVFDLIYDVREVGNKLNVILYYNTDLFQPQTIENFKNLFIDTIKAVTNDPFKSIQDIESIENKYDFTEKGDNFYEYEF